MLRRQLDELYVRADPRSIEDPELASDLARYLCVRVAGFLEQAVAVLLRDYCEKGSWGSTQRFAVSCLERMPNLRADALIGLLGKFNRSWASECGDFLAEGERGNTLNALIGIRNDVAHGRHQGLSREQVWSYYEVINSVIVWLAERVNAE